MQLSEKQQNLSDLISEGEKDKAVRLLASWATETSFRDVITSVLEPMLVEWGALWMQGKLSLAHGYLSGKVAEEFYLMASRDPAFNEAQGLSKGTVVLGNIEDDFHPLGRRLVHIYSKAAGWNIIDLGNDVPADVFVEKALETNAHIIAVSAMMFTTAKNITKVRKLMDERITPGAISLAVGGAVFKLRPELVSEVGGDGTADSAIEAPRLFEQLVECNVQNSVMR